LATVVLPVPVALLILIAPVTPIVTAPVIGAVLRLGRDRADRPLRGLTALLPAVVLFEAILFKAILFDPRRWLACGPAVVLVAWRSSLRLQPARVIRSSCGALLVGTPVHFGPWLRPGILSGAGLALRIPVSRILVLPCGWCLALVPPVLHFLARFGDSFLPVTPAVGLRLGLALLLLRGVPVTVLTLRAGRQRQPQQEDSKRERPQDFMVARERHVGSSAMGADTSVGLLPTIWPRA
jgi:hypothetical protein